jgi:hypothetical protein
MEDLPDFERGQIAGAHLAGASVTKPATLLRVLGVAVSMGISKNMNVHVEQVSGSTLRCLVLFFWYCFVPTGVTCKEGTG